MNARTQRLLLFLLTLVMVIFLAGCEQLLAELPFTPRTPAPTQPVPTAVITPAPTPLGSNTSLPPAEQLNQITLWLPPVFDPENGSPAANLLKQQLDDFSADHEEMTINVRIKAPTGPGGLLDSLTTASLAAPDVLPGLLILPRSEFEKAARQGLLMPVDEIEAIVKPGKLFPFAEDMTSVKGTRYALPFAGDALCMVYKPIQVAYPPTRWQELIQPDAKAMAFPAAEPQGILPLLLYMSLGGGFGTDETVINLREDALQESLLLLSDGANVNAFPYWLIDYATFDQSWAALKDSNATYAVVWTSQYLVELPENITVASLPAPDDQPFTLADGWVLAFPQTSSEQLARYHLLAQHLLDTDFQSRWTEAAGLLPVSEEVLLGWKNTAVSGILLEIGRSARSLPLNYVINEVGQLLQQGTIEMIRKQTSYIESSNKILKALSE